MFWPRYSRFHISFPAFVLSWTHIGSFCVHYYVHAGSHLAFWMCVLFSFKCCGYYSIHLKHAWLYLLYIFLSFFSLELRSWLQYQHPIFGKCCSWSGFGLKVDSGNASQLFPLSVSVSDSSPAHGESPDEVLRRRHGDKEVISEVSENTHHNAVLWTFAM